MKNEKFNQIMEKYVASTKRGEDVDLQKLKDRSDYNIKVRRSIPKYVWATCAVILVVVISLSIVLPIMLKNENSPQKFYCDSSQIYEIKVEEIAELVNKYSFTCLLPSVEFIESYTTIMCNREDDKEMGAFIEIAVFDEYFDGIQFNILKHPYALLHLQYFEDFMDNVKWGDITVRYRISDNNDNYYSYSITFTSGDYDYFINFDSYSDMTVTEALDMIYSDEVN